MTEGVHKDREASALDELNNQNLVDKFLSIGITEDSIKKLIDIGPLTFAKKKRPVIFLRIDGKKHKLVSITATRIGVRAKGIDEDNPSSARIAYMDHQSFIDADVETLKEKHYREDD